MSAAMSRLRALLAAERSLWMVNPGGASIDVIDMLARAGAKCVFIDCERTGVNVESVTAMARCAQSHGMAAVVRSESMRAEILVRYLDRGIDGIVVPHVETAEQARAIADVVRYATSGRPELVFTIAQIESAEAVRNAHVLSACEGIDGFLIGPNDLAHSLGYLGGTGRDEVTHAIDKTVDALRSREKVWGIPAQPGTARNWSERGARLLYCTVEQILKSGFVAYAESMRGAE
jgi:4-hydroxy-2-oxoheptanedioate aldolase